ncbi:hypothetical protein GCM10027592_03310 [Spirosoma flavus]
MKAILSFALMITTTVCFAQDWGEWIDVGHGIQVAFKYRNKPCQGMANTYARLRNMSSNTYGELTVTFDTNCDRPGSASVSAYDFTPSQVKESPGNWYTTSHDVTNIRLTKLRDKRGDNLLGSNSNGRSQNRNVANLVVKKERINVNTK